MSWIRKILDWTKKQFQKVSDKSVELKDTIVDKTTKALGWKQEIKGLFRFDGLDVSRSMTRFYVIVSLNHRNENESAKLIAYTDEWNQDKVLILGQLNYNGISRITPIKLVFVDRKYEFEIVKVDGNWVFKIDQTHLDMEFGKKTFWNKVYKSQNIGINVIDLQD